MGRSKHGAHKGLGHKSYIWELDAEKESWVQEVGEQNNRILGLEE